MNSTLDPIFRPESPSELPEPEQLSLAFTKPRATPQSQLTNSKHLRVFNNQRDIPCKKMLVSLHLPKTAGSSFLLALEEVFSDKIVRDFGDIPINTPALKRNAHALKMLAINSAMQCRNIECVHGHFLPLKYLFCRDAKFVTWLRDPIERLGSHYYYWARNYDPSSAPALHKRVIEEQWSLERFCLSAEMQNFYCKFLWGFPVSRFDFIGITEYFELDMSYFSRIFMGVELRAHQINTNNEKARPSYFEDLELRKKIEEHHSKDVSLYNYALDLRLNSRIHSRP